LCLDGAQQASAEIAAAQGSHLHLRLCVEHARPLFPPASLASQAATSAPLIERSIERATGIVYNITGGKDLTLQVG